MQSLLLAVDRFSTWIGKLFAWSAVLLTLLISWEVFSRYVLNKPHAWVLDAQIMLYGTLFMFAGAYTLSKSGHVRGDVLYGFFRPRTQATIDLVLYIVFFLPGLVRSPGPAGPTRTTRWPCASRRSTPTRFRSIRSSSSSRSPAACCCCRAWSRSSDASSACGWEPGLP
jgi:hypothetical protein